MGVRRSGVLLPVSALPGAYGCGTFGKGARKTLDFLAGLGFSAWQALPFPPPNTGNSPYSGFSAFAVNPIYIDPGELRREGFLTEEQRIEAEDPEGHFKVDYARVNARREASLRAAFERKGEEARSLWMRFAQEQAYWLDDYALYRALAGELGADWAQWPAALRDREKGALEGAREQLRREADYHTFCQWLAFTQWERLHEYARTLGIEVVGDMPMFVARESADTWAHPEVFALRDGQPDAVAGAPPDAFAPEGQLWGNPLYDWEALRETGYRWFLERLAHSFALFDRMRADHFRGFSAYWEVPAQAKSAKEGRWVKGPGMDFLKAVAARFPDGGLIAEDLGILDAQARELVRLSGFPGMRVLQFGFAAGAEEHLPHNIPAHCVAYTGTHDNNTTLGYLYETSEEERAKFLRYSGLTEDWKKGGADAPGVRAMLRLLWGCPAETVMVPFQDLMGWGADTRMNRPGEPAGQWEVRWTLEAMEKVDRAFIRHLQADFERVRSVSG